ncbi:hypothetical protein IGI04_011359 [Brassica rapa subsp. trilocularis]|uniref:Uncharacterized protein n=1 Tax=Brassica rapa subsp. trilocularis TaxID=1813537 RepID=A0ABQ7N2V3_BRACM|nr:hypothetical protein IGI04_011359 [Brassica rapa subsp. trilocularis]
MAVTKNLVIFSLAVTLAASMFNSNILASGEEIGPIEKCLDFCTNGYTLDTVLNKGFKPQNVKMFLFLIPL